MENKYEEDSMGAESDNIDVESFTCDNEDTSMIRYDVNNNVSTWLRKNETEVQSREERNETLCRVCGDISSGRHYGQYTCDGCSGFFMRSVRKNMIYRCKGNKSCVVDKKRRNQCQACRFEKCLKVNMNRYAVQQERQPNNQYHLPHSRYAPQMMQYVCPRPSYLIPAPPAHMMPPMISRSPPLIEKRDMSVSAEDFRMSESKENLCEISARLLYNTVKWARSVPAFTELPFNDQIRLLESSWAEIFILFVFQWRLHVNAGDMLRRADLKLSHKQLDNIKMDLKIFEKLSIRFRELKVSEDEFIYLKSIVLFKPELHNLFDSRHIERCQDRAQIMLRDYVLTYLSNQPARFGKLLLLLPEIKHVSAKTLEDVLFNNSVGSFSFEKILADLFNSS